jgi:hypothetical protein
VDLLFVKKNANDRRKLSILKKYKKLLQAYPEV